jgi:hypothetical protein
VPIVTNEADATSRMPHTSTAPMHFRRAFTFASRAASY